MTTVTDTAPATEAVWSDAMRGYVARLLATTPQLLDEEMLCLAMHAEFIATLPDREKRAADAAYFLREHAEIRREADAQRKVDP